MYIYTGNLTELCTEIQLVIFRSFILMAFHPSVTDTMGALHLARQFLITLDRILEEDSSGSTADSQTGMRRTSFGH